MAHTYVIHYSPTKAVVKTEEEFVNYLFWSLLDDRSPALKEQGDKIYRLDENVLGVDSWVEVQHDIHYGWVDLRRGTIHLAKSQVIMETASPSTYYVVKHQRDGFNFWMTCARDIQKFMERSAS